ncbi:MAG: DUF480 domain-containing protein [Planctomycetes bacterium]|nr:DUF480 domain-containing protein [Planctomycetota bacterium]
METGHVPILHDTELRVLGVLIEKSLTQPGSYPMTMSAIVSGANQKQNREPVLELSEGEIAKALHTLEQKRLVAQAPPAAGARVNRFGHRALERVSWDRREQAVMAELMLRGRQTPGELRTRGGRMTSIPDMAAVMSILQDLSSSERPFVVELPREPGRSASRFRHLLASDGVREEAGAVTDSRSDTAEPDARADDTGLSQRVAALEQRLSGFEERLARFEEKHPPGIDE